MADISGSDGARWLIVAASSAFDTPGVCARWDRLNDAFNDGTPVLDSKTVSQLARHFGDSSLCLAFYHDEAENCDRAAALLTKRRFGDWAIFAPGQSCVGCVIVEPSLSGDVKVIESLVAALPQKAFRLSLHKQDPALSQFVDLPRHSKIDKQHRGTTSNVDLAGTFDGFWQARHKDVRRSVRRAQRTLEGDDIPYELTALTRPEDMAGAVRVHGELEGAGWKGREGTAIETNNAQGAFYTELMESFAATGGGCAYQLRYADTVVASLLTIAKNQIQIVLKTTYDESRARYAPGRFLDYLAYQHMFSRPQAKVLENYTVASSVDQKWASGTRPIYDIDITPGYVVKKAIDVAGAIRQVFSPPAR